MTGTAKAGVLGRGPWFWGGMMILSYALVALLNITGAVEGGASIILMICPAVLMIPMFVSASRKIDSGGSACLAKGEAQKRYIKRVAISTSIYLVAMGAMVWVLETEQTDTALRFGVALLPGFAVIGVFWAIGRLIIEEQDEFIRMLVVRQALIATGFSLSLAAIWGFLEAAKLVVHADAYWWPVTWFMGLAIGAVFNRVQYGTWGAV